MTLPFIRQFPGTRCVLTEIACFPSIEELGREFIASGGRYLVEIMPSGRVRLAACLLVDGEQKDVEVMECNNCEGIHHVVGLLIHASVKHVREETIQ